MPTDPRRLRVQTRRWARRPDLEQPVVHLEGAWLRDDYGIEPGDVVEIRPRRGGGFAVVRVDTTRHTDGTAG